MNEDDILQALGARHLAELERRAPEWEDVVHGRRSAEEVAAQLRASGADEAEVARAAELFAPLPESFDDAIVDRLVATAAEPSAPPPAETEVVERRDRGFWRRGSIAAVVAAAAAALLVVVTRPEPSPDTELGPDLRALPAFELGVVPTVATVRSDHAPDPEGIAVAPGDAIELLLRPAQRHGESPRVWACLQRESARIELAPRIVEASAGATILARAEIPRELESGAWTLVAVVATDRPADDPCTLDDAPTHRVVRTPVRIVR